MDVRIADMDRPQETQIQGGIAALSHFRAGRLREAEALSRQALQANPRDAAALECLGLIAQRMGQDATSAELFSQAIALKPGVAELHYNLALALRATGRLQDAAAALRESVRLKPGLAPAHSNLGVVLMELRLVDEAEAAFREAVRLRPDAGTWTNLGKLCKERGRIDEAIDCCTQALRVGPNVVPAHNLLGTLLREQGRIAEAIESFRTASWLDGSYRTARSNLCYALHFDPSVEPQQLLEEHVSWARSFAAGLPHLTSGRPEDPSPDRRLRIGYVSPNLRNHVVGFFMEPILERHDRERFEVICYSDSGTADETARRMRQHVSAWRETGQLSDEQLAELIRRDRIDVLVDLNLHMRGSRLLVFARRPAPVQITHLGYCGTTGLAEMDWCVIDPHMNIAGCERYFTEKLLELPETYWCYRSSQTSPAVGPLPAETAGHVAFGSLNSQAKANDRIVQLWAQVLAAVPGSRLAVHAAGGQNNASTRRRFERLGVPSQRLDLLPFSPRDQYLDLYNRIDVALDPFPYCGGTTSLDALWMGVPLVTRAGNTPLSRTGVTLLTHVGLTDLIASSDEQYVQTAAALACDLPRLRDLRSDLRQRLRASPLMDEARYVRNLEEAYRFAWRRRCAGSSGSGTL